MKTLFISIFLLLCTIAFGEDSHKKLIAILTPTSHVSLEKIEKAFKETIEASYPNSYRFITYNAQGKKNLMRSEIDEIYRQKPALIFTIGTTSTQMVAEVSSKISKDTPIVFTCVNHPEDILTNQCHITGVKELLDFQKELTYLQKFKPNLQKILLVLNPMEPGLEKDSLEIQNICKKNDIELVTVQVFQTNELMTKISPFIEKADALIVLKDNTIVPGLRLLIKLCDKYHIPLMASDLDSPDLGCALGYGVYENEFGVEAAKKSLQILENQFLPKDIPVTPVSHFELKINKEACHKQGITHDI